MFQVRPGIYGQYNYNILGFSLSLDLAYVPTILEGSGHGIFPTVTQPVSYIPIISNILVIYFPHYDHYPRFLMLSTVEVDLYPQKGVGAGQGNPCHLRVNKPSHTAHHDCYVLEGD